MHGTDSREQEFAPYAASPLPDARRVLVFAPHPDDEVFGPGGTLACYRAAGAEIRIVVATDGAAGLSGAEREATIRVREAESTAAARVLGLEAPVFWRAPDRELAFDEALIVRVKKTREEFRADVVMAPAMSEIHPDHQALAMAVVEAFRRDRGVDVLLLYEVGSPIPSPSLLIDISTAAGQKDQAMRCFASQLARQDYREQIAALNRFRTYTLPAGTKAAEAFLRWSDPDDPELAETRGSPGSDDAHRQMLRSWVRLSRLIVPPGARPVSGASIDEFAAGLALLADASTQRETALRECRESGERLLRDRERLSAEKDALTLRLAAAEEARRALLDSRSWQLTAPVRVLGRLIRRFTGSR